jgi:hypothetical protein
MTDNRQIKDGLGNLFSIRLRDKSGDGALQQSMVLAQLYPLDYGTGGMFQSTAKSGTMAAGLAAAAPIYAFRWPSTSLLALVRRVKMSAWSVGAFTAGLATFDIYAARAFTAQYTGGAAVSLSGNAAKLRTAMSPSAALIQCATTAALTPGTRTLDVNPIDSLNLAVSATANTPIAQGAVLFDKQQGSHPLTLAQDEGFVIQATVPATGTWQFAVVAEWDEVAAF